MIQLLISSSVNIEDIKNAENNLPTFQLARVSEMIDGWLILIEEKDDWDSIELAIEDEGDVTVVGSYYDDGSLVVWGNSNQNNKRGHTISKYSNKLNDIIEYDENGEEVNRRRPSETESLSIQCNLIAGYPNRQLD